MIQWSLDSYRGLAAQKAIQDRRLLAEVAESEGLIKELWDELHMWMSAAPSATWEEAADKAAYLLQFFATTPQAQEPRRQRLITSVLEDFARLTKPRR